MAGKKYKKAVERLRSRRSATRSTRRARSCRRPRSRRKCDETVDIAVRLGVNPKHADQMVRGAVVLPHGTGKTMRVLVFAKGDKAKEALEAGADFVGGDEYIKKIKDENWLDFDTADRDARHDGSRSARSAASSARAA